ncbi:MAG TPA: bifunctional 5,10-methylenetetrahydrofolate dehydrogenase/5,10-methenyltetrahydrofolate cyclohydrolase [Patescibacteria group bacterium]
MIIFDGKTYAQNKERELGEEVSQLKKKGITPKLVTILVGKNPASILYTNLKKKAAERIKVKFEIINLSSSVKPLQITTIIKDLNKDEKVHGIMVQLPLPTNLKLKTQSILNAIDPTKDVDGLTKESTYMPATTKAVLRILGVAKEQVNLGEEKVVVVGSHGMVGKSVVKELKNLKYKVTGLDIGSKNIKKETLKADILISATGKPNLIKANMVKEGSAIIDVGSPKPDVAFNEVASKAVFITPVPGGVGPVTIVSLLENLVQPLYNSL